MLNRSIPPIKNAIATPSFVQPKKLNFGDSPVFYFEDKEDKLVHISISIPKGYVHSSDSLPLSLAQSLLLSGTKNYPKFKIAEKLDYYGVFSSWSVDYHYSTFTVVCLNRVLDDILPLIDEVLNNSIFEDQFIEKELQKRKQNLSINRKKVKYVGKEKFSQALYGDDHIYGKIRDIKEYDNLNYQDIETTYTDFLKNGYQQFFVTGNISKNQWALIEKHLYNSQPKSFKDSLYSLSDINPIQEHFSIENAIQSSVNYGFKTVINTHPDFLKNSVVSMTLGGYFGSRLMKNIREDKGYTYGIGAHLKSLKDTCYFNIRTEVGNEFLDDTLTQINIEIDRLKNDLVSYQELEAVKNTLLGNILSISDGLYNQFSHYQSLYNVGFDWSRMKELVDNIHSTTPEILRNQAEKFFVTPTIITVGK